MNSEKSLVDKSQSTKTKYLHKALDQANRIIDTLETEHARLNHILKILAKQQNTKEYAA